MLAALRPAQTRLVRTSLSLGNTLRPALISLRTVSTMSVPRGEKLAQAEAPSGADSCPDVQHFLRGYPGQGSSASSSTPNLDFYRNAAPCRPDRLLYEDWMKRHEGEYDELESNQYVSSHLL